MKRFYLIILLVGILASCQSKKEKLSKAILEIENSDSSASPTNLNKLADLYMEYAETYPEDSISERYLFKGFIFKYLGSRWDESLKYAAVYKSRYQTGENYHRINLKIADIYYKGIKNQDSAVKYYLKAAANIDFSTAEFRNAAQTLTEWVNNHPQGNELAEKSFQSARFFQMCGDYNEAVDAYQKVAEKWPEFKQSPDALMAAGFINWNHLNNPEKAAIYYQKIIDNYPNNKLSKEAKMILDENLMGMSEMELVEYLAKKNKENAQ